MKQNCAVVVSFVVDAVYCRVVAVWHCRAAADNREEGGKEKIKVRWRRQGWRTEEGEVASDVIAIMCRKDERCERI